MRRTLLFLGLLLGLFLGNLISVVAAPLQPQDVPEPLRPWIKWSLYDHKEQDCPFLYNNNEQSHCLWPSHLELKLTARGGDFSQQWLVLAEGWISLPGNGEQWPQEVKLDNHPALVTERDGIPSLRAQPGSHTVSGLFFWDTLPQALQVPHETGLVTLTLESRAIDFPEVDASGKLWLRQATGEQEHVEDRLDMKVYRRITDEIPLMVTTRIDLQVSGKQREVLLGPAITQDYIPLSLNSPVPARLEPDGRLRVQVRAGQWTIVLIARHTGAEVNALPLPVVTGGPWPEEEVWVFEARPHLRQVAIDGVPPIDPQQTTLPADWRSFPAYRIRAGEALQLVEKKRGDPDPAPDQLTLGRHWWLDFNGRGYTIQDQISGTMTRGWRLDLNPPGTLGRVAVDGQEQFITKSDQPGRAGVELRRGQVNLVADSRLEGKTSLVPAVSWDHDFNQVNGQLHLPPGWRVLTVSGVDSMPGTWLEQWTLLDLFIVFLIALAVAKLWDRRWGIAALVTLILIAHEPQAPWWLWLQVLAAVALLRVLPAGWPRRVAYLYRAVAVFFLVLSALYFMLQQARAGLYPQLERPWEVVGETPVAVSAAAAPRFRPGARRPWDTLAKRPEVQSQMSGDASLLSEKEKGRVADQLEAEARKPEASVYGQTAGAGLGGVSSSNVPQRPPQYDPNAAIQTGPGLPRWRWTTLSLGWNGPVERSQKIHFVFLSPRANRLLAFLRIFLLAALVLCVADLRYTNGTIAFPSWTVPLSATGIIVVVLLLSGFCYAQGTLPSQELLNELRNRLLQKDPPECLPLCATSPRLHLELTAGTLRVRQEIHNAAHVAVPLPGLARHWLPHTVLLDGNPARGLLRMDGGQLWIELPAGQHQVVMEGPLPNRETVELPLPLKPHAVQVQAEGWEVEGVHEDGLPDDQLEFRRMRRDTDQAVDVTLEPGTLPPFVRVERTLHLGLTWGVDTRILRVSPRGSAVVLEVPSLEGESVTSAGIRVESGKVLVNMAPGDTEAGWSSVLEQRGQLTLTAPETTAWTEIWRLDVSPIWRVEPSGIPVIHNSDPASGYWLPEWRPWPGESVALQITRPEGLPGQTLTIDSSFLEVTPGRRATDARLHLEIRSSRGGQHTLALPESTSLQSVSINDQTQAIRQDGRTVTFPLTPGAQTIDLQWRQTEGISTRFRTPTVDLGIDSVNTHIQLQVPYDRWVLFCGGPRLGPAVLFWAAMLVVVVGAIGLGYVPFTPLRTRHWVLLGIGLTPVLVKIALLVVIWLLVLGLRKRLNPHTSPLVFNAVQLGLLILTLAALGALFFAIQTGLMGYPEMRIAGNGSSNLLLRWYQDRTGPLLPQAWMFSLPLLVYRLAMLAWALWLAFALIRWLRWGWECFSTNGLWRKVRRSVPVSREGSVLPPAPSDQTAEG